MAQPAELYFLSDDTSDAFLTDGGEVYKTGRLSIGLILLGALPCVSLGWPWVLGGAGNAPALTRRAYVLVGRNNF